MSDLNNLDQSFRLGSGAARVDDIECLDWNKKVPHILVTGSSAGFVTVWDVKTKKESLTLNNLGRKPVSAVAWDPEKVTTVLATSIQKIFKTDLTCLAYETYNFYTLRIGPLDFSLGSPKFECTRTGRFYNTNYNVYLLN